MMCHHPGRSAEHVDKTRWPAAVGIVVLLAAGALGCQAAWPPVAAPSATGSAEPTETDGVLPDGVTVSDTELPGIAKLRPELRDAVRRAGEEARQDGIEIRINSGWRSVAYQNRLLEDAIDEYGSEEEAARWVATGETSAHVTGDAVDVAPYDAVDWLARHGAAHGLCQIYGNESWHYELRPDAVQNGCPAIYPDPTYDPRLQH